MNQLSELGTSRRQQKNEETRRKLYGAMEQIMNEYDYNTVTIRNICKVAGVAYGSFYNLFENKETFLMYYLSYDFLEYQKKYYEKRPEFEHMNNIEKSIDIFVCCANYNVEKGIKFIRGFYLPNNGSLFPNADAPDKDYAFTPLVRQGSEILDKAKESGELPASVDSREMIYMYCYLFNGITFNWCLSGGKIDMVAWTERVLKSYARTRQRENG